MATLAESKISVTTAELSIKEPRLQWVTKVDDYITVESLDIIKLSVRSELTETECNKIKAASDVYHKLAEHYSDPEVLLARFIYALEKLGHRRYGHRAIRELKECYRPSPFDFNKLLAKTDKNEFILLQRLAVLCCMLPEDYSANFIRHLAKKVKVNPEKYTTPCQILEIAIQKTFITPDSHVHEIEEALIQANLPEIKIRELFDNYNKIDAGLECKRTSATSDSSPEKSPTKKLTFLKPTSSSYNDSSGSSSLMPNSTPSSDSAKHSSSNEDSSGSSSHHAKGEVHRQLVTEATENTPLLRGQRDQQTGNPTGNELEGNEEARVNDDRIVNQKKKCLLGCCFVMMMISLVMVALAATLIGFTIKYQRNQPTALQCHHNSSVVLAELNHLSTSQLSVMEDTEHLGDIHHDITVYQAESECSNLKSWITYTENGSNNSPTSTPSFYALAGSSVALSICGSTNLTVYSERLEIVLMNDVDNPYSNDVPYKVNFFDPGLDGKLNCKNIKFNLETKNYYSLSFIPPPTSMSFQYELTYNISVIDPNLLAEHAQASHTLHADQDSCNFTMSWGINSFSCFVAVIRENPNTLNKDVHIHLSYVNQQGGLIAGIIIAVSFIITLLVAVAMVIVHVCKKTALCSSCRLCN